MKRKTLNGFGGGGENTRVMDRNSKTTTRIRAGFVKVQEGVTREGGNQIKNIMCEKGLYQTKNVGRDRGYVEILGSQFEAF